MSVKDVKDHAFTYNKTIHNTYIVLAKKFLHFMGSKCSPSTSNLLQQGKVIMRVANKPCHLESKTDFEKLNFLEQEDWRIQKKSCNLKSDKVMDTLG